MKQSAENRLKKVEISFLEKQNFLRYHLQNCILISKHLHTLFHKTYVDTKNTLSQFLKFLVSLLYNTMLISSQVNQEWLKGSETRVYDPERIMKPHERLEKIQNTVFFMI